MSESIITDKRSSSDVANNDDPNKKAKISNLLCNIGSADSGISDDELRKQIYEFLAKVGDDRDEILILPPDITRFHSQAGKITQMIAEYYNFINPPAGASTSKKPTPKIQFMPALGTHAPMTKEQISDMFGEQLAQKDPSPFLVHDWRNDVVTIGHAPSEMVKEATHGMVDEPWPAQLNKLVWSKNINNYKDDKNNKKPPLILSIGQVVPHEVMGMANFNKNLFVGVGGVEAINLSHFIGAVYGMEKMMGKPDNPLRRILNYCSEKYLQPNLDLYYVLTVIGSASEASKLEAEKKGGEKEEQKQEKAEESSLEMKGLYIGNTIECYNEACKLSLEVNFNLLDHAPKCMVVYLDPKEFHSTWLGNKAIYRTRMAIADEGELIILAPGVIKFGEDDQIDQIIRQYGYVGTPKIMQVLKDNPKLKEDSLSAIAHQILSSSEGRFNITYCPSSVSARDAEKDEAKKELSKSDIEGVGYQYADLNEMYKKYDLNTAEKLQQEDGWYKDTDGNEFYYISNPALGLWAVKDRFEN